MTNDTALASRVAHAIRVECSPARVRSAPWQRSLDAKGQALQCEFCLAPLKPLDAGTLSTQLVSSFLGGPISDDNRVLTCRSCANARDGQDVVGWPAFHRLGTPDSRARVLARRANVLTWSANHLTPTSRWARLPAVLSALAKRWEQPRIKLFAFHGSEQSFIGWTPRCGSPSALGMAASILRFGFQATPIPQRRLSLFDVPAARFLDAVWELIEHGALLAPVELENETAAPTDPGLWQSWWPITFTDPADIRRRRPYLAGNHAKTAGTLANQVMQLRAQAKRAGQSLPDDIDARRTLPAAPRKPRPLSTHANAVAARAKYRRGVQAQRTREWLETRASLDDYKQRVREGRAQPATLGEQFLMEQQVMDLYDAINRW